MKLRVHTPREHKRVKHAKIIWQIIFLRRLFYKAGIKRRVVRHKHTALAELEKLRQYLPYFRCILYHFIVYAGEVYDVFGDRLARVYEC